MLFPRIDCDLDGRLQGFSSLESSHSVSVWPLAFDVACRTRPRHGWARPRRPDTSQETAAGPGTAMLFPRIDCIVTGACRGVSSLESSHGVSVWPPALDVACRTRPRHGWARPRRPDTSRETAAGPETAMLFRRIDCILTGACGRVSSL